MTNADTHYFQRTDRRGAYLVLGEGDTLDAVTVNGRWLATDTPEECLP